MKYRVLYLVVLCSLFVAMTGCNGNEIDEPEELADVTFSFNLPAEDYDYQGVQERMPAAANVTSGYKLCVAVYTDQNASGAAKEVGYSDFVGTTATMNMRLPIGKTFYFTFLAMRDVATASTTTFTNDHGITYSPTTRSLVVNYTTINSDNSSDVSAYDIFVAKTSATISNGTNITATLHRIFSQVNIGITETNWNAAVTKPTSVRVNILTLDDTYNLMTEAYSRANTSTSYLNRTSPISTTTTPFTSTYPAGSQYKWVAVNYILCGSGTDASRTRTTTLYFENGGTTFKTVNCGALNYAPNKRTNVHGAMLDFEN